MKEEILKVRGAKEHNLKDVSVDIPKNKLVVITCLLYTSDAADD